MDAVCIDGRRANPGAWDGPDIWFPGIGWDATGHTYCVPNVVRHANGNVVRRSPQTLKLTIGGAGGTSWTLYVNGAPGNCSSVFTAGTEYTLDYTNTWENVKDDDLPGRGLFRENFSDTSTYGLGKEWILFRPPPSLFPDQFWQIHLRATGIANAGLCSLYFALTAASEDPRGEYACYITQNIGRYDELSDPPGVVGAGWDSLRSRYAWVSAMPFNVTIS